MKKATNIFWFRRDLRYIDNHGFYNALREDNPVLPLFIFDTDILDELENRKDARVEYIHASLLALNDIFKENGSSLIIKVGRPVEIFKEITRNYLVDNVFTNHDYEPYASKRDKEVLTFLDSQNIPFHTFKDQVIFEKDEVTSDTGKPYKVYTAYKNKWILKFRQGVIPSYGSEDHLDNLFQTTPFLFPSLKDIGFQKSGISLPLYDSRKLDIKKYDKTRDFPYLNSTTRIGTALRFGTVSIRQMAQIANIENETWLNELVWREFFMQLLYHFPQVTKTTFNPSFEKLKWRHDEYEYAMWKDGRTGYPLVDAGMRELRQTGFMHNRVRMVAASFLTKHLLIDYKWGEAYFAEKLLDFELASNNGNWQWVAGTGADAQPFFRIFNPSLQQERFDKQFEYIKKWVPEYGTKEYPLPIVDHKEAVARAKEAFGLLRSGN